MSLVFREICFEDITQLVELYETVLNKRVGREELEWRFFENPISNRPYNLLCFDTDRQKLAGHTAFIPVEFLNENQTVLGALSAGSMVHPEYTGLFPELYKRLEKALSNDRFDFLYAFPNPNSFPFFKKYFNYNLCHFSVLTRHTGIGLLREPGILSSMPCMKNKFSSAFVDWRIRKSPLHLYEWYRSADTSLIYKIYKGEEIDIIFINDFQGIPEAMVFFNEAYPGYSVNIYSTNTLVTEYLKTVGFSELETPNNLVVKPLNGFSTTSLCLQMIDSDIF